VSGTAGSAASNDQGGGVLVNSGTATLENTIIVLDSAGSGSDADVAGTFSSSDDDLIGDPGNSNLANGTHGDNVGQSAATLAGYFNLPSNGNPPNPLIDNIGPTATFNPTSSNPAVFGKGDTGAASIIASAEGVSAASATDQRGVPRLYNGTIDIGAVQSGLFVLDNTNPNPVTAGTNITYNLTVINGGPSDLANPTLSDTLPANTTFQSFAPVDTAGKNWALTQPAIGATGTVTATISSFPANSTASFTLIVQVNASAAGGTVIANTATLTGVSPKPSVTVNTTVAGSGTTNITSDTSIQQTPLFRLGPLFVQLDLVTNTSSTTFNGPVDLVITGLPPGVTLLNASGTVASGQYAGDPYIQLVGANSSFKPGEKILVPLLFYAPGRKTLTFATVVVEGI
jgi:uncharacterized repeat protein (TIGR01451 family)